MHKNREFHGEPLRIRILRTLHVLKNYLSNKTKKHFFFIKTYEMNEYYIFIVILMFKNMEENYTASVLPPFHSNYS